MNTKTCRKCKEEKKLEEFSKQKKGKFGVRSKCKKCLLFENQQYRLENKEKFQICRRNNKDKKRDYDKIYRQNNRETISIRRSNYYQNNKENIKIYNKNNKDKINQRHNNYFKKRKKYDLNFKITCNLRTGMWKVLKGNFKSQNTLILLGCSVEFFISYFESKFNQYMNWEHYEKGLIHIDHIRPCISFNMSNPEEQKICFHYTNLQPLWATTTIAQQHGDMESMGNLEKGSKIII